MKSKKTTDNKIKQILLKAGPYLDVLNPIFSGLWITISFIPVIIPLITHGAIPEIALLQAFLISELGILFSRQTISFTSWLSDTTGTINRIKKNDEIANTLRGLQLTLLLISFFLTSLNFLLSTLPTAIKAWTTISDTLILFSKSPAILLVTETARYAPIVSAVAGVLGISYYLYQAYQASKDEERYRAKNTELEERYPQYAELYQRILHPKANIQKLCQGLPREAGEYLFLRHFNETKQQENQKAKKDFLFWAGICAIGLGITLLGAAAALTPVGAMVIAGAVTVAMVIKIGAIIGLLAVSAAITRHYLKNKWNAPEKNQRESAQRHIECALKVIETNNISQPIQPTVTPAKTAQAQQTPVAAVTRPVIDKAKLQHYKLGFFQTSVKEAYHPSSEVNLAVRVDATTLKR